MNENNLLFHNENAKFQKEILNKIHADITDKSVTNDSAILDMIGVSYLSGYADVGFDEVLPNNFEIDVRDSWEEDFDELKSNTKSKLATYYKKASELLENGDDPDDVYLKPSSRNDSKLVSLTSSDMKNLYNYLKKYIKKSNFTVGDRKTFEKNIDDLSTLIG